jgi:hypothetical protein
MIVIGIGVAMIGYTLLWWGYSLVKGYDITFAQIVSPVHYYTGAWPPAAASPDSIFPGGKNATAASAAAASSAAGKSAATGRLSGPSRIAAGQVPGAHG